MAKVKCRPVRVAKPGRKTVIVRGYRRTPPKPIRRKSC